MKNSELSSELSHVYSIMPFGLLSSQNIDIKFFKNFRRRFRRCPKVDHIAIMMEWLSTGGCAHGQSPSTFLDTNPSLIAWFVRVLCISATATLLFPTVSTCVLAVWDFLAAWARRFGTFRASSTLTWSLWKIACIFYGLADTLTGQLLRHCQSSLLHAWRPC